jgi:hypothetical protein
VLAFIGSVPLAIGEPVISATAGSILFAGTNGVLAQDNANLKWGTTAGQGLTAKAGTATTDVNALYLYQEWNNNLVAFNGVKVVIKDTQSAAGALPFQILGGAAGTTNLLSIGKAGSMLVAGQIQSSLAYSVSVPQYSSSAGPSSGFSVSANGVYFSRVGVSIGNFGPNGISVSSNLGISICSGAADLTAADVSLSRLATGVFAVGTGAVGSFAGSLKLSNAITGAGGSTLGAVTCSDKVLKTIASIADNTATPTFTVTVPNAAHSATIKLTLKGSLGAGGAVGSNEASGSISYDVAIARTSGVATVATFSTAYGSSTSAVAGAATVTITAAASGLTGANNATQTFTIDVTIARGSGSSTNHTCQVLAEVINANASGVTIA